MEKKDTIPTTTNELELAYSRFQIKRKKGTVLLIVFLVILILSAVGGYFLLIHGTVPGKILSNITIAGVDVGGMTREEAVAAVQAATADTYDTIPMEVVVGPYETFIPADVANVTLDVQDAVKEAYGYGRTGSYAQRRAQQLTAAATGYQVDTQSHLSMDTQAVKDHLQSFISQFNSVLSQSTVEISGPSPDLGAPIDALKPQTLVITKGTSLYEQDLDGLYDAVLDSYQRNVFVTEFACAVTAPDPLDLQAVYDQYASVGVDAVMDPETFQITREINGYDFDLERASVALEQLPEGGSIEIPFRFNPPEQTYDKLYASLFQDELASYTAYEASDSDRATNLRLASEAINGMVLYPGQTFSYNEVLGERTTEKGYRPGDTFAGGAVVSSIGGGICQVASALYYCSLYADLEIVERSWHMFPVPYVPYGMDATIYWGAYDYKFRNNFNYPIRIDVEAVGGSVDVRLMGTDEKDYYIKMDYEIVNVLEPETIVVEMPADNPYGYKDGDVITSPHTGYFVRSYKYKYSKADDSLIDSAFVANSHYRKCNKEVVKIIEEPAPSEPVPADPSGVPGTVTPDI